MAITMVGDAMEAGSALDVVNLTPDASAIRALTEGHAVMFWVVAGLQIFGLATIFGGTSDRYWFSSGGVGVTVTATFPWVAWVITVGVVTIRGHSGFRRRGRALSTVAD